MQFVRNLNIGKKLGLGFGAVTLLMLLLTVVALTRMSAISDAVSAQNQLQQEKLAPLYDAREALAQTGLAARNAFIFQDQASAMKELDILDQQKALYLRALQSLASRFGDDADFARVRSGLLSMSTELERPRKYRAADDMAGFGRFLVEECSPLRRKIVADIDVLIKKVESQSTQATLTSNRIVAESITLMLIIAGIALLTSAVIAVLITRGLLKQLGGEPAYAVAIAGKIAEGDLSTEIVTAKHDNSSLLYAIKTMRDNLADIVRQVRSGTDMIASSSADIAQGNIDLSSRTEQQAFALERTSTEMQKLTSTVRGNADNTQQANQLAVSASGVAAQGGEMVEKVIETMQSINASSRRIEEIISVIDGIAFQTNILALNAAVEAARAGEAGRGFAVVATEVRNLAQRSASAAKEIKTLIDASVAQISSGTKLVEQAGDTMQSVVVSVRRVTDVVGEISEAGRDQSNGIESVSHAVIQMDETTQQNAALVEEAAAAAQALHDQAATLADLVKVFVLSEKSDSSATAKRVTAVRDERLLDASLGTTPLLQA
ncbi:MAG: methyl-accepting chemotaxis protein [Oxalicibacterium faecigallinarum]|uniref:methyl-accepting chemotaxis protein n=1 Tax=Oxalicibacterium faecigallinarum TaxID=573741 RepID=UPI002808B715|nr:methyl-accepting chemotaxis protein [Oxalicibacterium faecigallinarum]MDQ7969275.1 methyl-accepting chemotaxis protein [Oxalicibacterium faecigallinarum]